MATSDYLEDNLFLENIDEYVYDMDKIVSIVLFKMRVFSRHYYQVTYKWLAMTLSVSFNEATR